MSYKTVSSAQTWVRGTDGLEPEPAGKMARFCSAAPLLPIAHPEVRACAG